MSLHENIVITKQEDQENQENQKCTICWNNIKLSYTTPCNHEFCHKCIKKNIETYEATSCPICRYQFNEVELHNIKIYKKHKNCKNHEITTRPITRSQTRLQRMNEITEKIVSSFTLIYRLLHHYRVVSNRRRLYFTKTKIDIQLEKVFSLIYQNPWYIKQCDDNNSHIIENIKDVLAILLKNDFDEFYDSNVSGFNIQIWMYKFREIGIFTEQDVIV